MLSLVYVSAASREFEHSCLMDILNTSYRVNTDRGITGILLYAEGNFLQLLEGPGKDVERTYAGICRDNRHTGILKLLHAPVEQRLFPAWTMAFQNASDLTPSQRSEFGASLTKWRAVAHIDEIVPTPAMSLVQSFFTIVSVG
jgi:hypothetical protein